MLIRPRVMALCAAICSPDGPRERGAGTSRPHEHFRRHGAFQTKQVDGVCAQVGVAVSDHVHAFEHPRWVHELRCEQPQRSADQGTRGRVRKAGRRLRRQARGRRSRFEDLLGSAEGRPREARRSLSRAHRTPRKRLLGAQRTQPGLPGSLEAFWASAHEAAKSYRAAVQEACKTFHTALTEFEEATKSIMAALEAADAEHHFQPSPGPGGPVLPGSGSGDPGHPQPGFTGSGHGAPGSGRFRAARLRPRLTFSRIDPRA